jgi:hypothetical protein
MCEVCSFRKIPQIKAETKTESYFVLQVKWPSLLADHNNKNYTEYNTHLESARHKYSGNDLERKPKYKQKFISFFTSTFHYGSNATNLKSFVTCAWKAHHMMFQINPTYGNHDEKLVCSPSIVHVCILQRMLLEENPSNWNKNTHLFSKQSTPHYRWITSKRMYLAECVQKVWCVNVHKKVSYGSWYNTQKLFYK